MATSTYVQVMSPLIFALCWFLLAFPRPRLGRTLGTLLCAALMVLATVLSAAEATAAVQVDTLAVLFGTMLMAACLEREGAFRHLDQLLTARLGGKEDGRQAHYLLIRVCALTALLSAVVTNDTCCVVLTPLLMGLVHRHSLPPLPFLLALATSANIGSSCSPVGNPQNMLVATASGLPFATFLSQLLGPTLLALALNTALLCLVFNGQLAGKTIVWTEAQFERRIPRQQTERELVDLNSPNEIDESVSLLRARMRHSVRDTTPARSDVVDEEEAEALASSMPPTSDPRSSLSPDDRNELEKEVRVHLSVVIADQEEQEEAKLPLDGSEQSEPERSRQTHHPQLDLSQEWARSEYLRRVQLETFYGLNMSDAAGKNSQLLPATPPDFVYVPPVRRHILVLPAQSEPCLHMMPPEYTALRAPILPPPSIIGLNPLELALRRVRSVSNLHRLLVIMLATVIGFLAGASLAWCAICGAVAMMLALGVDPDTSGLWNQVDFALLIFFSGLFVVVEGFHASEWPEKAWAALSDSMDLTTSSGVALYVTMIVIGSNTVSNVPLVLILTPALTAMTDTEGRNHAWLLLAFVSTLAGNLTLVGSVANLIVSQRARPWYTLTFMQYLYFGLPSTIVLIVIGVAVIQAV